MSTTTAPTAPATLDDASPPPFPSALHGPVLLATDGRARTDASAAAAHLAARRIGARLDVVAAVDPLPAYTIGYDIPILPPAFDAEQREALEAAVCRRLEPVLGGRDQWELELRHGRPARAIAAVARERRAGLIVLGSGAHRPVDRLLGEAVSVDVVRHTQVPVLVVPPDGSGPLRRAVVGVDFGAASVLAAQAALALLDPDPDGAPQLTLVHVRSALDDAPGLASWAMAYDATIDARFARLRELLRPFTPDGVRVETRRRTGAAVDCLMTVAKETGADLIAVGTHGAGWVERLFVGSVATATLRRATTAVLVTPAPAAADRVRLELRVAGETTLDRPGEWAGALDALTRRNLGRRARLEVWAADAGGLVVAADGPRFGGASYDAHTGRVEVMLRDGADPARHLTHGVPHARRVEIIATDARRDHALLVEDGRGATVLTFAEP